MKSVVKALIERGYNMLIMNL